jgi:hypothetical protein
MSYPKIKVDNTEFTLTPDNLRSIIPQIKSQVKDMSFQEISQAANALGVSVFKLPQVLKSLK